MLTGRPGLTQQDALLLEMVVFCELSVRVLEAWLSLSCGDRGWTSDSEPNTADSAERLALAAPEPATGGASAAPILAGVRDAENAGRRPPSTPGKRGCCSLFLVLGVLERRRRLFPCNGRSFVRQAYGEPGPRAGVPGSSGTEAEWFANSICCIFLIIGHLPRRRILHLRMAGS